MAKKNFIQRIRAKIRGIFVAPYSQIGTLTNPNQLDFGVTVNNDAALRFTAVFAAIKILSENIASLPKTISKKTKNGNVAATWHAVYHLLSGRPNEYTDRFNFWFTIISWMLGNGNAYALIEWKAGEPVALHQIDPSYVDISFDNGKKAYVVNNPSEKYSFLNGAHLDFEMLHFMLYTKNGIEGIDTITYNAAAIGRGIATQKFSSEFYSKGGQIKGTLETDAELGDEAYAAFVKHYNESANNFETPLLEYGIKYKTIGISPVAAQLIQSETLSIQDIARIFSIPPHLLAEMSHATFSNIEEQNTYFAIYSLRPLCKRIEEQLEDKLLLGADKGKYDIKFDLRGMMRGKDEARSAYYNSGINAGWMTPNEARELEGMVKLPGLDTPRMPLNYVEVGAEETETNKTE